MRRKVKKWQSSGKRIHSFSQGAKGTEGLEKEGIFGISEATVRSRMERVDASFKMAIRYSSDS